MPKIRTLALEVTGASVPAAVSTIILRNRVLYAALKLGIVNYHALASRIAGDVAELTGKQGHINTIVVAIKRFADNLPDEEVTEVTAILREAKLTLTGDLVDLTIIAQTTPSLEILERILRVTPGLQSVPSIFQLPSSVKLIADEDDAEKIRKALAKRYALQARSNVARISVRMPRRAEQVPGIASFLTDLLYRNGIGLLDAFLGYEDILLIVEEQFGPKVYQLLREEMRYA
jgi:hypothetical protein